MKFCTKRWFEIPIRRLKALFAAHFHYDHVLDSAYIAGSQSTLNIAKGEGLEDRSLVLFEKGNGPNFAKSQP